mmetsp:Transcript_99771/g.282577  ORF Transcript_99771/g.282577 Transcript_99771/m.282577 type:complete len:285 (+) Transcript_99771:593-1447(+)
MILNLVCQNSLYAGHASRESREVRARVLREHGKAPIQTKNYNLGWPHSARLPHLERLAALRRLQLKATAALYRTPGGLHRPAKVARLRGHPLGRESRDARKGLVNLLDAHPAQVLADVHEPLAGLRVPQGLGPAAEDLLAELVHAHAAVVERRGAADALRRFAVAPGDDGLHGLEALASGQRLAVLGLQVRVVRGAEHDAELAPPVLARRAAQVLRPVALGGRHHRRDEQQAPPSVDARVVHAIVRAAATPRVGDGHTPCLPARSAVAKGQRGAVQVLLPLLGV